MIGFPHFPLKVSIAIWVFTLGVTALDLILVPVLFFILNPKFDSKFKVMLSKRYPLVVSRRLFRAFWYGCAVVIPGFQSKWVPSSVGYDFKSKVGSFTYFLCVVHTFCVLYGLFVMLPLGMYLTVCDWFAK